MLSFICFTIWVILSNTYYVLYILMLVTDKASRM